jgi:hypothetical protein
MAYRRTKRRKTTTSKPKRRVTRRKSFGAVSQGEAVNAVVTILGGLASRVVTNNASKIPGLDKIVTPGNKGLIQIGLGILTPMILGKKPLTKALSNGMIFAGGLEVAKNIAPSVFGQIDESDVVIVSGLDEIGAMDMLGASADEISEINGMDEISEINGMDEYNYNY